MEERSSSKQTSLKFHFLPSRATFLQTRKIHDEQHNDLPRADCEICMKRVQDFHRESMKAIHDVYEHDVKPRETCEYCKKNVEDEKNL